MSIFVRFCIISIINLIGLCGLSYANPAANPAVRIALLLPTQSESLAQAANALRAGVMAAYQRDSGGTQIELIETSDAVPEILTAYQTASSEFDLIIGPLTRSAVSAIAQSGKIDKPTVALGAIDSDVSHPKMLAIGLSIEDEARQLAQWASSNKARSKLMILSTNTAWQRRAAKAFANQWLHLDISNLELSASGGYLSTGGLKQLKAQLQTVKPNVLFLALDALQTEQVRSLLPPDSSIYGSSQLNALPRPSQENADPKPSLEGIRFLELPWQVQPEHTAVMIYPRLIDEPKRLADNERLYALGIDAFRIAREISLNNQTQFNLDGVTGLLKIQFNQGPPRFERKLLPATFRAGTPQAMTKTP